MPILYVNHNLRAVLTLRERNEMAEETEAVEVEGLQPCEAEDPRALSSLPSCKGR